MSLTDPSGAEGIWVVPGNSSLQDVLFQWCREAGWTLVWNSQYGFQTQANSFAGSFIQAVEALFESMRGVTPGVHPVLYSNSKVVEVRNNVGMD